MLVAVPCLIGLSLAFALMFNYGIKRKLPCIDKIMDSYIMSMATPVATLMLLVNVLFGDYGYINGLLDRLGADTPVWLNSENSFRVLHVLYLWHNCAFCVFVFISGLSQVDRSILEAAALDGANAMQKYIYFVFPEIFPHFIFNGVIAIMGVFKLYRESYILFGDYPYKAVYMLQNFLNNNFVNLDCPKLSCATVVFFVVIIAPVLILVNLYSERKELK